MLQILCQELFRMLLTLHFPEHITFSLFTKKREKKERKTEKYFSFICNEHKHTVNEVKNPSGTGKCL
jgi:hypothetical protein